MVWRRLKGNFQSEAEFIDALNKKPELDYDYLLEKAGSPRLSSRLYSMIEYELRHMRNGDEKWSQTGSTGSGSVFCPHGVGGVFQGARVTSRWGRAATSRAGSGRRYSWSKNRRSLFVNRTRPRTLRYSTVS